MSPARWTAVGAALAGVAVATGAFGAHGLRDTLSPERLDVWRTAASYQLVHGVGLVALAGAGVTGWAPRLLTAGVLVFSGSLYTLCLTDVGLFGAITPLGGSLLIGGWVAAAVATWRRG